MDDAKGGRAVFELFDPALAQAMPDVIGLWETKVPSPEERVSFDMNSVTMPDAPVWRTNFPANLHLAETHLARGEARLRVSERALNSAADRMDAFVRAQIGNQSFTAPFGEGRVAQPETELLVLLNEIREGNLAVSYELAETLSERWDKAAQKFESVLERLRKFVAYYAWVETHVGGQLLGLTTVSWTGDAHATWLEGLGAEQVNLHQRTLALAMGSRDTLMRMFILTAQCAVKLSILVSTPGGVILVLPVAWKYINQVLAELDQ